MSISDLRREYSLRGLSEDEAADDPFTQFRAWFDQALAARVVEPNAMTLATVAHDGQPSARIVLLKEFDTRGFVFYTNYESRKGQDLAARSLAALTFFWPALERQVRVEGWVEKAPEDLSTAYFQSRPLGSQVGAWASPQSQVVPGRAELEAQEQAVRGRFGDTAPLPRPPHWGGYVLRPQRIEFWQGRPSRLHDRILYERVSQGWKISRLAP